MNLKGLVGGRAVLLMTTAVGTIAHAGQFDGVTVNIMTFTGPQIAEPLQRHAPEFEKLTGAKVNVITVPFSDLYTKLLTDWSSGTTGVSGACCASNKPGAIIHKSARIFVMHVLPLRPAAAAIPREPG